MLGKGKKESQATNRTYEKFLEKLRHIPSVLVDTLYLACVLELSVETIAYSFDKPELAAKYDLVIALRSMDRTLPRRKRQGNLSRDELLRSPLLRNPHLIQALNQMKEEERAEIDASLAADPHPYTLSPSRDKKIRELLGIAPSSDDQADNATSEN